MKKIFLFSFLTANFILWAQDSLVQRHQTHNFNHMSYQSVITHIEPGKEQEVVGFPSYFKQINQQLNRLKTYNELLDKVIKTDSTGTMFVYSQSQQGKVQDGLVVDLQFEQDPQYDFYQNGELLNSYRFLKQKAIVQFALDMVEQGFNSTHNLLQADSIESVIYDRLNESSIPVILPELSLKKDCLNLVFSKQSPIETLVFENANTDSNMWYTLAKRNSLIHFYSFQVDPLTLEVENIQKAVINNIGFDQKRIIVQKDNMQDQIWNVYFEPTRSSPWVEPNQYLFDYYRKSDKKPITARVVADKRADVHSYEFNLLLSLAQNPELFKITTKLIDLDYTGFCDKQVLQMIQDFKQSYIPKS